MPPNGRQENRPHRLRGFYGKLPTHPINVNRGRLDRKKVRRLYSLTERQLSKAYLNWQDIFRVQGSNLTFKCYLDKLTSAKITPDDIGNSSGKFNLSRINDSGPYTNASCRFILRTANIKEQKNLFGRGARI